MLLLVKTSFFFAVRFSKHCTVNRFDPAATSVFPGFWGIIGNNRGHCVWRMTHWKTQGHFKHTGHFYKAILVALIWLEASLWTNIVHSFFHPSHSRTNWLTSVSGLWVLRNESISLFFPLVVEYWYGTCLLLDKTVVVVKEGFQFKLLHKDLGNVKLQTPAPIVRVDNNN